MVLTHFGFPWLKTLADPSLVEWACWIPKPFCRGQFCKKHQVKPFSQSLSNYESEDKVELTGGEVVYGPRLDNEEITRFYDFGDNNSRGQNAHFSDTAPNERIEQTTLFPLYVACCRPEK